MPKQKPNCWRISGSPPGCVRNSPRHRASPQRRIPNARGKYQVERSRILQCLGKDQAFPALGCSEPARSGSTLHALRWVAGRARFCPQSAAKQVTSRQVAKTFRELRKAAGLPASVVLYAAQHTYGMFVYEATKNLQLVMNAMGHGDGSHHDEVSALRSPGAGAKCHR
jgi:hypothetical protein